MTNNTTPKMLSDEEVFRLMQDANEKYRAYQQLQDKGRDFHLQQRQQRDPFERYPLFEYPRFGSTHHIPWQQPNPFERYPLFEYPRFGDPSTLPATFADLTDEDIARLIQEAEEHLGYRELPDVGYLPLSLQWQWLLLQEQFAGLPPSFEYPHSRPFCPKE